MCIGPEHLRLVLKETASHPQRRQRRCLHVSKKEETETMSQYEQHDTREGMVYQQKRDGRWVARLTQADGTHKQVYCSTSEEAIQSLQMLLGHAGQSRDDLYLHPPHRQRQGQLLSAEQARRLLKVARYESPDIELLLTLALSASIRRGELLALQWDDIDLESRRIQIRRSVNWLNSLHLIRLLSPEDSELV